MNKALFYMLAYGIMVLVHLVGTAFDEDYKESSIYIANMLVIIIITFFQMNVID